MFREWKTGKGYLKIPIEVGAEKIRLRILVNLCGNPEEKNLLFDGFVPVSENKVDFWGLILVGGSDGAALQIEAEDGKQEKWYAGIQWEDQDACIWGRRPVFHLTPPSGSFHRIGELLSAGANWEAEYEYDPFGKETGRKISARMENGRTAGGIICQTERRMAGQIEKKDGLRKNQSRYIVGDVEEEYLFEEGTICMAKSRSFQWDHSPFFNVMTPPLYLKTDANGKTVLSGGKQIEKLRTWKREWENLHAVKEFRELLRFRVKPSVWPNIELIPPEGKSDDVTAKAFEIHLELRLEKGKTIQMNFCGFSAKYNGDAGLLQVGDNLIPASAERLRMTVYADTGCAEWICGEKAVFRLRRSVNETFSRVDNSISGNLEKCRIKESINPEIYIWMEEGEFHIEHLEVYGLQRKEDTDRYLEHFGIDKSHDPVFYESAQFAVHNHYVRDNNYGYPDAVAPTDEIIVSPVRVVEEFDWRKTPFGDMTRVVNRDDVWRASAALTRYPEFYSPVTSLNAAYRVALDVFEQCKRKKFALNGQAGLWSAGLFQGPGEGFGVWLRDSTHVLLRCGALVDPKGAKKTIRFAMEKGFDNGSDGPAMGAVGLWDYYLVTGNTDILYEMWPTLLKGIEEADRRFDEKKGLVAALNSTSNDAFPEPENGGFSLSTECYFMKAYESIVSIAELIGYGNKEEIERWRERGKKIRTAVRKCYWNPQYGYYTSGPEGSQSFEKGFWETSGEESVLWPKFNVATKEQRRMILRKLESTAMTEYGIKLFPYRKEKNHFCGAVWGVWQAGFAAAASVEGDSELIRRLLAQQIRVCLMNKTFYEVIDADSGIAWRWPGQLWNAAGFVSLILYGVFGIEYNTKGMYFHPAVSKELAGVSLRNLSYRRMTLDIRIYGWGATLEKLEIDGRPAGYVDGSMEGRHEVVLYLS